MINELKKRFPEGSWGGQCAAWIHNFMEFDSIGDSYAQKKRFIQFNGIIAPNIKETGKGFRVGDFVVTSEGTFMGFGNGHVALIYAQDTNYIYLAESNFRKDERVHYGRKLLKTDSRIYGLGRFPFKLDLGVCEINYNVFFNNSKAWNLGFLDELQKDILTQTNGKLKVNFFPLNTAYYNWDYKIYEQNYKVISREYIESRVMPLRYPNAHAVALVVAQKEWQGSVLSGGQEIAYYHFGTSPAEIQIASDEFDLSPWYAGMRLIKHTLPHELSHFLHYINGLNDTTHNFDNPTTKQLDKVFSDLDFNRIKSNI